jgi:hypothetical protein
MPLAVTVLVVGTTVLIVAIVVAMNAGKHSSDNQPVAHGSTPAAQSSSSHPSTAQSATTPSTTPSTSASSSPSSSPSTTPSTSAADTATQLTSFITGYYSLLPGNLSQAWPFMTADYQTNTAGGLSGYTSFWNNVQQVSVSDVVATPPSTVVASIHFSYKNGTHEDDRTTFGLVKSGNSWKIASTHN